MSDTPTPRKKPPYRPPTLIEQGLENYLNKTKAIHDGYGYKTFIKELAKNQNVSALSRMFKVSRPTIDHWLETHAHEQGYSVAK